MDQTVGRQPFRPEPVRDILPPTSAGRPMPDQVLRTSRRQWAGLHVLAARLLLLGLWTAATTAFGWTLYRVLSVESPTELQLVFLGLSTLCFAWVAIGSCTAVVGLIWLALGRRIDTLEAGPGDMPSGPTALLFPVYREDAELIAANISRIRRDLETSGAAHRFAAFILSDTQDALERRREERAFEGLCRPGSMPIYVRWRTPNAGRKSGNIRDWIERYGAAYPCFVILDADSVMSADTLLRLARAMEAHPRAGLIQTVPRLAGGTSLFARLQEFASGTYGPVLTAGLAAWQGPDGNYWGHNAIVRTEAFAGSAGLPTLRGRPPLGGAILSHDFVEAALLRRDGWEVHLVPSLGGSSEGCPPSLADLIVRDRRWAQGNLQHIRLLAVPRLALASRLHLAMGAFAYIASPLWALTLICGVVLAVQATYATPAYFGSEVSLFPKWPVFDAERALGLLIATIVVVHLPKLLGAAWCLRNPGERHRRGGVLRVAGGVAVESLLSTLIAPILMLTQTRAVLGVLLGADAGWGAQRRVGAEAPLADYVRQHRWHVACGLAGAAVCWAISPAVLAWMSPIILGLTLAPVLAMLTAAPARPALARLLAPQW
ncbi:MAG: glucans biosynthesis glucosyltransferase MdoH [Hyphomicrobiaceae bacterium]|nr:glucans biosynthesis glucosyltransferase MdoH [Hyphomicrobiaceae bacterium]